MTRKMLAEFGVMLLAGAMAQAAGAEQWIHVRVDAKTGDEEKLRVAVIPAKGRIQSARLGKGLAYDFGRVGCLGRNDAHLEREVIGKRTSVQVVG
jgi:hypothetical protein